jgi:hypothetical protein
MSEDNRKLDLDSELQQLPARRDVALGLLGGALGGAALLSGCVPEANALTGANITWVDAIGTAPVTGRNLNLRGKVGSNSAALIVALGYAKRGDGGGGLFSWMTTNAIDNGGTIIVANRSLGSQTAGPHWKRIYSGAIDPRWFGAVGNGIADDAGALARAAAAIAAGGTIALSPGQYKLSSSITFGEAISLEFTGGALLAPATGATLTILGPLRAANAGQIFTTGAGTVSFGAPVAWARGGNSFIEHVNVKWWGAKSYAYTGPVPPDSDSTRAFQAALDTNKSVFVPDGVFYITGITLRANEQNLVGTGTATTMLRMTTPNGTAITIGEANQWIRRIYIQDGSSNDPNRQTIGIDARTWPFLNLDHVLLGQFWRGIWGGSFGAHYVYVELHLHAAFFLDGESASASSQECEISHFGCFEGQYGIVSTGGSSGQHRISHGVIIGASNNGIMLAAGTNHNSISDVMIKGCGLAGVYVESGSYDNTIQHCTIWGNGRTASDQPGVHVANASLTKILGCSILDNGFPKRQTYGVYMAPNSKGTLVANNVLSPNLLGAFLDDGGTLNRVYCNSENNTVLPDSSLLPSDDLTHMNGTFVFNKGVDVPALSFGATGPTISKGLDAPTLSAPNGSLYLRTDGSGPYFYVRENGAWVGK